MDENPLATRLGTGWLTGPRAPWRNCREAGGASISGIGRGRPILFHAT
jgi:hypothetical protein